jgi:hypothetical protein
MPLGKDPDSLERVSRPAPCVSSLMVSRSETLVVKVNAAVAVAKAGFAATTRMVNLLLP